MDIAMSEQAYETDAGQTHDPLFAEAVRKAAAQLNQCIAKAHEHGLKVDLDVGQISEFGPRHGQPAVNVTVFRVV